MYTAKEIKEGESQLSAIQVKVASKKAIIGYAKATIRLRKKNHLSTKSNDELLAKHEDYLKILIRKRDGTKRHVYHMKHVNKLKKEQYDKKYNKKKK